MSTEAMAVGHRMIKPSEFEQPETFFRSIGCDAVATRLIAEHYGSDLPDLLLEEFQKGTVDLEPLPTDGDRLRGKPRSSAPFTRIYMRMIREKGPFHGAARIDDPVPTPTRAWLQVKRNMEVPSPSFSHQSIAEAVEALGGYSTLRQMSLNAGRKQFVMTYKELVQGW